MREEDIPGGAGSGDWVQPTSQWVQWSNLFTPLARAREVPERRSWNCRRSLTLYNFVGFMITIEKGMLIRFTHSTKSIGKPNNLNFSELAMGKRTKDLQQAQQELHTLGRQGWFPHDLRRGRVLVFEVLRWIREENLPASSFCYNAMVAVEGPTAPGGGAQWAAEQAIALADVHLLEPRVHDLVLRLRSQPSRRRIHDLAEADEPLTCDLWWSARARYYRGHLVHDPGRPSGRASSSRSGSRWPRPRPVREIQRWARTGVLGSTVRPVDWPRPGGQPAARLPLVYVLGLWCWVSPRRTFASRTRVLSRRVSSLTGAGRGVGRSPAVAAGADHFLVLPGVAFSSRPTPTPHGDRGRDD